MPKFRKKPVVINAFQPDYNLTGLQNWVESFNDNYEDHFRFIDHGGDATLKIKTLEGEMVVGENDWVIRGVKGEYYPCKNDIFLITYEPV